MKKLLLLTMLWTGTWQTTFAQANSGAVRELNLHVLVVYNKLAPDSESLARYYATVRQIPDDHVLGLECPDMETISRKVYNEQILGPINRYGTDKGWFDRKDATVRLGFTDYPIRQTTANPIWCIVLIRGIPLRIDEDPTIPFPPDLPEALHHNRAAVDSELATLPTEGLPINGELTNPYYSEALIIPFSQKIANMMVLVARLDGPEVSDVKHMIDSAIATEKTELTGRAYFDLRNITDPASPYKLGDDWIRSASQAALAAGLETDVDVSPDTVPVDTPWDSVALYAGWYAQDCTGPFLQPDFHFQPGAVAYHLHSFSAETVRSKSKNWVGPLISRGAAATMGSVYEPYLHLTPNVGIFFRNLLAGESFGEAAYQSQSVLSWTITVVGDPLYRPYPRNVVESARLAYEQHSEQLPWLALRLSRMISAQTAQPLEDRLRRLQGLLTLAGYSGVYLEGYADILESLHQPFPQIEQAYRYAMEYPFNNNAAIRTGLKLAALYQANGQNEKAAAICTHLIKEYPEKAMYFKVQQIAAFYANEAGAPKTAPPKAPAPENTAAPAPFKPALPKSTISPSLP